MKNRSAPNHGFALVIALSLMAFILLLILSITTLVRVETQSANIQLAQLEARMNAQLGAMIALGDLQRYTGPDQRVTARADILLAPGASGIAGQSRWTGVWSSKADVGDSLDAVDELNNRQPKWLVSGLNPDAYSAVAGDTADLATVGKSVIDKSASTTDDTVKAPKVEILGDDNVPEGHYAYWVSDEGVKARVNMADPHLVSVDPEAEYYRTAMAQVADPTAVSNSAGDQLLAGTSSRWKDGNGAPGKISSLKNIPMFLEDDLPGGTSLDEVNREFFHDFTVHSSGVLANTKDGGLKRDLSTALLSLPSDMQGPMFPPANANSTAGSMDPGGPKWEQLSDYYQLAKANAQTSSSSINLRMPSNEQVGFTPVVTRSNFFIQGFAERNPTREASTPPNEWCLDTTGGGRGTAVADWAGGDWYYARGYRYSLGMFPLVTLWNPYDRDMVLGDLGLEFELPRIDIVDGTGSNISVAGVGQLTSKWNATSEVSRFTVKFVIRGITLKAGEAVNFSPPSNSYYDNNNPTNNVLVARASAPSVTGFFTPPVASSSNAVFWDDAAQPWTNYGLWSKSRLSLNFSNGGSFWRQLVMLYQSPDLSNNNQFLSENRFKLLSIPAFGDFNNGYRQPRVILTNRLVGSDVTGLYNEHIIAGVGNGNYRDPFSFAPTTSAASSGTSYFNDFIGPVGDSKVSTHLGSTDIIEGVMLQENGLSRRNPLGAFGAMKFPQVPVYRNQEIESHLFLNMNPTAPVIHHEPNVTFQNQNYMATSVYTRGEVVPWVDSTRTDFYTENVERGTEFTEAFVGLSNTAVEGSNKMILFEVPDNEPLSIGQLAHANLMNHDVLAIGETIPAIGNKMAGNSNKWDSHTLQLYGTPTHAIGNSAANPLLSLRETERLDQFTRNGNQMQAGHYDYSYKLNEVLWDEFYFSGIKDPTQAVTFPLPNSRLQLSGFDSTNLMVENRAAANLLLDGAFNINSTSVAAWESVLGAMRDVDTLGVNPSDANLRHNFARFSAPLFDTPGEKPEMSSKDELAAGFRNLSDTQIARLAQEIVNQVRLRSATPDANNFIYPFLSLSSFINRSTDISTLAFAYNGALQAAIDAAEINGSSIAGSGDGLWDSAIKYPLYYQSGDTPVVDRPLVEGMPGFLMQSDLLAKLGAFLQARSDTFIIRSYGSSLDAFGNTEKSRAYFEMVVQRSPSYVSSADADYDAPSAAVNEQFGRRYNVISQRWVTLDEI